MKRDPLRQLERLRQMREERAATELARRSDLLRKAQASLAEATEAVTEQAVHARREEWKMLADLAGQSITLGGLFRVHSKLDAFAAEHAQLANVASEREDTAKTCADQKQTARKTWRDKRKAVTRIDTLVKAWLKRQERRALALSEAAEEDRPSSAPAQAITHQTRTRDGE